MLTSCPFDCTFPNGEQGICMHTVLTLDLIPPSDQGGQSCSLRVLEVIESRGTGSNKGPSHPINNSTQDILVVRRRSLGLTGRVPVEAIVNLSSSVGQWGRLAFHGPELIDFGVLGYDELEVPECLASGVECWYSRCRRED